MESCDGIKWPETGSVKMNLNLGNNRSVFVPWRSILQHPFQSFFTAEFKNLRPAQAYLPLRVRGPRERRKRDSSGLSCRRSLSYQVQTFRAQVHPSIRSFVFARPSPFQVISMSMQSKRRPERLSIIRYIRPGPQTHYLTTPSNPNPAYSLRNEAHESG